MNIFEIAKALNSKLEVFMVEQLIVVSIENCFVHEGNSFSTALETGISVKDAMEKLAKSIQGKGVCNKKGASLASLEGHWYEVPKTIILPRFC